jgi:hypothetical protein
VIRLLNADRELFARHAVSHLTGYFGKIMSAGVKERTVAAYQTARLKEGASPKTIGSGLSIRSAGF